MSEKSLSEIVSKIKSLLPVKELFKELYPDYFREHGNSLCPFHEDTNASFSFPKGKPFAKCHSGCTPPGEKAKSYDIFALYQAKHSCDFKTSVSELAKRAGVSLPEKGSQRKDLGEPTAVYPYHDEGGELLFEVCRFEPKDFRQRRPDPHKPGQWLWSLGDTRRVLFGLPELLKAAPDEPILILEGEKDVLTARSMGFVATTAPGGAGKWTKLCKEHAIHEPLKGRIVTVIPDNDESGRAHADAVARSLRGFAKSVKIIELPDLPEKGDLTDYAEMIDDDGLARELIIDHAAKTPEYRSTWTGPSLVSFSDLMSQDLPEPRWIIHNLLPEGLCVLAGAPKIGKSWLAHSLSLSVSSGGPALGRFTCSPGYVLHLALEDNPRRFRKRMSMMLGDDAAPDRAFFTSQWPYFSDESKEPDGLHHIHRWLEHHGDAARLIVIDTLQKVRQRKRVKDDVYGRDYRDMEGLQQLAGQCGVAILVIHHQNKGEFKDVFNTVSGSTGITGAADTVWILDKAHRLDTEGNLFISGRDLEESKGALRFDRQTGLWTWLGDALEMQLSNERREIREVLRSEGRPLRPSEIADQVGSPRNNIQKLVTKMLEAGEVQKAAGQPGKYVLPSEDGLYGQSWSHAERKKAHEEEQLDYL